MRARAIVSMVGAAMAAGVLTLGTSGRRASEAQDPRAAIFVTRGCAECHAIAALGVKAKNDVGPDLTFAYADVANRYGVGLSWFLENPRGLMGFVLAAHLNLSPADRDSMSHTLEAVYNERLAGMDENMPSSPPARGRPRAPLVR